MTRAHTGGRPALVVEGRFLPRRATDAEDRRRLAHALGYLQTSRTAEAYPLFTAGDDAIGRAEARGLLLARRDIAVLAHRHILSPDPRLRLTGREALVGLVRTIYATWATERGWGALVYTGAIHANTGVLHAHVLVGAQTGTGRPLHLWPDDYAALTRIGDETTRAAAENSKERRRALRALVG